MALIREIQLGGGGSKRTNWFGAMRNLGSLDPKQRKMKNLLLSFIILSDNSLILSGLLGYLVQCELHFCVVEKLS